MSLSTLLSDLFSSAESETELPAATQNDGNSESGSVSSVTIVRECRHCGTNVSAGTDRCPTCESDEIVTYSIE